MERRKAFIPRFSTKKVVLREKMSRPQESESSPRGGGGGGPGAPRPPMGSTSPTDGNASSAAVRCAGRGAPVLSSSPQNLKQLSNKKNGQHD